MIESHKITDKKFNIKKEHELYYEKKHREIEEKEKPIIIKELENIIYDND